MYDLLETVKALLLDVLVTVAHIIGTATKVIYDAAILLGDGIGGLSLEAWVGLIFIATTVNCFQLIRLRRRIRKLEEIRADDSGLRSGVAQLQQQIRALAHEIEALEMHIFSAAPGPSKPPPTPAARSN